MSPSHMYQMWGERRIVQTALGVEKGQSPLDKESRPG